MRFMVWPAKPMYPAKGKKVNGLGASIRGATLGVMDANCGGVDKMGQLQ